MDSREGLAVNVTSTKAVENQAGLAKKDIGKRFASFTLYTKFILTEQQNTMCCFEMSQM